MDADYLIAVASNSWLKWFCCPNCGNDFTISLDGHCVVCNEPLVLVKSHLAECSRLKGCHAELNSLIPWQAGSSFYYYSQWNRSTEPEIDVENS